jgi:hypothetical protein
MSQPRDGVNRMTMETLFQAKKVCVCVKCWSLADFTLLVRILKNSLISYVRSVNCVYKKLNYV